MSTRLPELRSTNSRWPELRWAGIVLAAGRARRMGALKQTLPWPPMHCKSQISNLKSQIPNLSSQIPNLRSQIPNLESQLPNLQSEIPNVESQISNLKCRISPQNQGPSTIISCAFDAIAPFCERMFIVVGHDATAVLNALGDRPFTRVDADSDDEMFASIRAGLQAAAHASRDRVFDGAIVQPADHPGVARETIETLCEAGQAHPRMAVMPEYRGRGGHPVIIPREVVPLILDFRGPGGLRQFWLDHPEIAIRESTVDPLCVADVDTPEQYQAALLGRQA